MTEIEPFLTYSISIDCFATNTLYTIVKNLSMVSCRFLSFIPQYKNLHQKKNLVQSQDSFSLLYILIYVHGLLNIPLIHVFSTYMLGILRIHHPSLHYNMSEFHFLQYQRRLIYQPSPMSVSCQSTSVV